MEIEFKKIRNIETIGNLTFKPFEIEKEFLNYYTSKPTQLLDEGYKVTKVPL